MNFEVGDTIGAYRLVAECGQGAYGTVFVAESTVTRRRVALKIVYRHGRNCERELRGLARYQLICPRTGLLQVYHVEECGEYFYYTMDAADDLSHGREYVPDTLANRLRTSGKLPAEAVRKMADELVACLNTLHGKGLLHRDVKPDNILWIDGAAKPGDIGLVAGDGTTALAGTPGFMPPEVLAGTREYEQKDDFYALGKVIYCALTGNPVEKFPSFPDSRTLGDCGDLVTLYNRLCRGEPVTPSIVAKEHRRSVPWIAVAAAGALALVCGAAAWFLLRPGIAKIPSAAPETASVPKVQTPPASADDDIQRRRSREIDRMTREYAMSAEFENIRRQVAKDYEYLCSSRRSQHHRPFSRFHDPVTVEDQEFFDREHANDPVWQFGKLSEEIDAELKLLRDMSDDVSFDEASFKSQLAKCRIALHRRKKLEATLLKKYKSRATASASDKKSE